MDQLHYHLKNDYNKAFKVQDKTFYCFSHGMIRSMYFDEDDYRVAGDVFRTPPKDGEIIGTFHLDEERSMDLYKKQDRSALVYKCEGFICVSPHKYVRLFKKRFF